MEENIEKEKASKRKLPIWFTSVTPFSKAVALILFITLPFIGFCLGFKYSQKVNVPKSEIVYEQPSSMQIKKVVEDENSLAYILATYCDERSNEISVNKVPFEISNVIKNKYDIGDNLSCGLIYSKEQPNVNYVQFYADGLSKTVFIFHKDSLKQGSSEIWGGDPFGSLEDYKNITVGNKVYKIYITGDQLGYNNLWLRAVVLDEKSDDKSGSMVRVFHELRIENLDFVKTLVKKYGKYSEPGPGVKESYYSVESNNQEFLDELTTQLINNNVFDDNVKEIQQDLDGITFK